MFGSNLPCHAVAEARGPLLRVDRPSVQRPRLRLTGSEAFSESRVSRQLGSVLIKVRVAQNYRPMLRWAGSRSPV